MNSLPGTHANIDSLPGGHANIENLPQGRVSMSTEDPDGEGSCSEEKQLCFQNKRPFPQGLMWVSLTLQLPSINTGVIVLSQH